VDFGFSGSDRMQMRILHGLNFKIKAFPEQGGVKRSKGTVTSCRKVKQCQPNRGTSEAHDVSTRTLLVSLHRKRVRRCFHSPPSVSSMKEFPSALPVSMGALLRAALLEDPATGPRDAATGPRDLATGPRDAAAGPRDPAAGPRDPATGPRDPAAGPRDPAAGPRDPATGPRDPAAGPRDAGLCVVGVFGKSGSQLGPQKESVLNDLADKHLFPLFGGPEDGGTADSRIQAFHHREGRVLYLLLSSVGDSRQLLRACEALGAGTSHADAHDVWKDLDRQHCLHLLYLFSVCHVLLLVHPNQTFDVTHDRLFRALDALRQKVLPLVRAAIKDCPVSKEWKLNCRPCPPRLLFVFHMNGSLKVRYFYIYILFIFIYIPLL